MSYKIALDMNCFNSISRKDFIIFNQDIPYLEFCYNTEYGNDFNTIWYLKDRYRLWFKEINILYSIEDRICSFDFYIIFENKSDAMLFKLTWL
jgi:hypothetical protein